MTHFGLRRLVITSLAMMMLCRPTVSSGSVVVADGSAKELVSTARDVSLTLRGLLAALESAEGIKVSVVVFPSSAPRATTVLDAVGLDQTRELRICVHAPNMLVALPLLAHELQHALEIWDAGSHTHQEIGRFYRLIGSFDPLSNKADSKAAHLIEHEVRREIRSRKDLFRRVLR